MIGYLSFYYDVNNFTDRTMVVLTTMLVIATITSSIESVINIVFYWHYQLHITHEYIYIYFENLGIAFNFILQID